LTQGRFRRYLEDKGILDDQIAEETQQAVEAEIQAAVESAETRIARAHWLDMFVHVLAERPSELEEQREIAAKEFGST
jgi:TPP-dependent pyruvate/acetoin dehydrogenase alpha subunit